NCTVVGDVVIGADSSVWFNTVIRGDVAQVTIGQRVNVQDLALIHCDTGVPNVVENDVTIGHGAIVHGKRVGAESVIGMGATLLSGTVIGRQCLIGAGALVPPRMNVADRSVVMGVPGKIVRQVSEKDWEYMQWLARHYVELAQRYARGEVAKSHLDPQQKR
ncbi:MAG: gamma carbonic anhydrase family protein, partial [Tepidisphaeraceae bacterium]